MPKIEITEPELVLITTALQLHAMNLEDCGRIATANVYEVLRRDLHTRFAIARVLEETKDPDRSLIKERR